MITASFKVEGVSMVKEVVWENKKWKVFIYLNKNTNRQSVGVANDFYSDWPIKYSDGRIGYDNPYIIPKYVKVQVAKAFKILKLRG